MDDHTRTTSIPAPRCAASARCRDWRNCPHCGRIRQARIADLAELLARHQPNLYWTILQHRSNDHQELAALRRAWARRNNPPGALWTLERGQLTGNLHCNIIHCGALSRPPLDELHWSTVITGNHRRVAAYISKPATAPIDLAPHTHLYGTLGPLWLHLTRARQAPTVQAAAYQLAIDLATRTEQPPNAPPQAPAANATSTADYRAIAARYLPDLLAATAAQPKTRPPTEDT